MCSDAAIPPQEAQALHKKSRPVIDRPYSLGFATVGALYERPRFLFCAKPEAQEEGTVPTVHPRLHLWLC